MKDWPKNGLINFGEAIGDLMKAVKAAYRLERRRPIRDIPWCGFDTPDSNHVEPDPENALKVESMRWSGHTPMEEILGIAFRLGYTQGIRRERSHHIKGRIT